MKMQVLSDIHLEYYDNYPGLTYFIEPKTNILILAGDICYYKHKHFLSFFREVNILFEYVIFVPGNHEYYSKSIIDLNFSTFESVEMEMKKSLSKFENVYLLQKDTLIINNIKFIGTTLWYQYFDKNKINNIVPTQSNEFILYNNCLMPHPTIIEKTNKDQLCWLENEILKPDGTYKIVITHYLPSEKCIADKYLNSPDNFLFVTNCEQFFKYLDYWIYGHTHIRNKFTMNNCVVLSNPFGLPKEQYLKKKENCIINIPTMCLM